MIICVAMLLSTCSEFRACLMETWGCCKTLMMGYVVDFVHIDTDYIMLDYDFDPKLCLCTRCWKEHSLSPGVLKRTLSHI